MSSVTASSHYAHGSLSSVNQLKIDNKLFAVHMTWLEITASNNRQIKREIQQSARLLNKSYGVVLNKKSKNIKKTENGKTQYTQQGNQSKSTILGLTDKNHNAYYALAPIVANKLKDGIFITDKIIGHKNTQDGEKLYWLCVFSNKELLVNINLNVMNELMPLNISGDELLNVLELKTFLNSYLTQYHAKIMIDMPQEEADKLGLSDYQVVSIESIVQSRIASKFIVKRQVNNNYFVRLFVIIAMLSIIGFFAYEAFLSNKDNELPVANTKPVEVKTVKAEPVAEEKILLDLKQHNLYRVLSQIKAALKQLPVSLAGWVIQDINYSGVNPKRLQVTYKLQSGADIYFAKEVAQRLIFSQPKIEDGENKKNKKSTTSFSSFSSSSSLSFYANDQMMCLMIPLPEIDSKYNQNSKGLVSVDDLTVNDIKNFLNENQRVNTIAKIQRHFLNYRLGQLKPLPQDHSKQEITIANIDSLSFKTIQAISQSSFDLVAESIIGKFQPDFTINFEIRGNIYA